MQACLLKIPQVKEIVDTRTAAVLLSCDPSTITRKITRGEIFANILRSDEGQGGITYTIPVSALPPEAQMKWRAMQSQKAADVDLTTYKERKAAKAVDRLQLSRRARVEEKRIREEAGRAVMNELQAKVNAMEELALLAGRRGGVLEAKQAIADRLGIRLRQLYEYQKAYESEGWAGLMDKTERADKGRPRTMCLMAQDYIAAEYCTTGKARQNVICDNLQRLAEGLGCSACDICPHNPGSLDVFLANYQQDPQTIHGQMYPTFRTYKEIPTVNGKAAFDLIFAYTDTADTGADNLCSFDVGRYQGQGYILDVLFSEDPMEITETQTADMHVRNKVEISKIESNNGGRGFGRNVERLCWERHKWRGTTFILFTQTENKTARILTHSADVMRNILWPEDWEKRWPKLARALKGYKRVGVNAHDDAPDALTGVDEMLQGGISTRKKFYSGRGAVV